MALPLPGPGLVAEMKQLAIIRDPRVAAEDHSGKLSLFFDTYIEENRSAMQVVALPGADIPGLKFDASSLDGRPCWVEVEGNFIRFVGWWK